MGCGVLSRSQATGTQQRAEDQDFSALTHGRAYTKIEEVAFRGILPSQLQELVRFVRARCKAGSDVVEGWYDKISGAKNLRWQDINLYHLNSWVINPLTAVSRCSYVEAVTADPQAQRPAWFVSHWWGEPVADFVACVVRHQYLRGLQAKCAYWVCAYANNQHELGTELGTDPMQSSFLKAMRFSAGVLLILDVQTPANAFSRVWCCFEEAIVTLASRGLLGVDACSGREHLHALAARTAEEPLLFDVAAVDKHGFPQLITQGLTAEEEEAERGPRRSALHATGWQRKITRELDFPLDLVRTGLNADIVRSSSTMDIDKSRILNALAGCSQADLDATPDTEHPIHGIVNQILHSTFALAAWHQAVVRQCDVSDAGELPLERALREDATRQNLELNLSRVAGQAEIVALARVLPSLVSLKRLDVVLKDSQGVSSLIELCASISSLTSLEHLRLDISGCHSLSKTPTWISSLASLTNLQSLRLEARYSALTHISEFAAGLGALTKLKFLLLDISCCHFLESMAGIGSALAPLASLQELRLDLGNCGGNLIHGKRNHDGIVDLARGLASLTCLRALSLDLNMSSAPSSYLKHLKEGLAGLKALNSLGLNLSSCRDLEDLELLKGLGEMRELQRLRLDVSFCLLLQSIGVFGDTLQHLQKLEMLDLRLGQLLGLTDGNDAAALGHGLAALQALRALHLSLSSTDCLANHDGLWKGLAPLTSLEALSLDCSNCQGLSDMSCLTSCCTGLSAVRQFSLNLSHCGNLQTLASVGQMLEHMPLVEDLAIQSSGCTSLANVDALGAGFVRLKRLENLDLQLGSTNSLASLKHLGQQLQHLSALKSLRLDLGLCRNLADLAELGAAIKPLSKLNELGIVLDESSIDSLDTLGSGMADLSGLRRLSLSIRDTKVTEIGSLFPDRLPLRQLCVDLTGCLGLKTTADLHRGLAQLSALDSLTLHYWNCTELASVAGLGRGLSSLSSLRELKLILRRCCPVSDWEELWPGLASLAGLQTLELNLEMNERLSSITGLAHALVQLRAVQVLNMNLAYCSLDDVTPLSHSITVLSSELQSFRLDLSSNKGLPSSVAKEHCSPSSFVSIASTP